MIKKLIQIFMMLVLVGIIVGCSDDDETVVIPPPASQPKALMATLDGNQQVPPLGGVTGSGTGSLVLSADRTQLSFSVSFGGLTGAVTVAHFHHAKAGSTGAPVRTITGDLSGNTFAGTWTSTDPEPLTAALVQALLAGDLYLNIHTGANAAGEIRGQVVEVTTGLAFDSQIDSSQAVPPVAGVTGTGTGFFVLNTAETELTFNITFDGLTGAVTVAHFHNAAAGVAGPPVRTITVTLMGNSFIGSWSAIDGEPLTAAMVAELKSGNIYINIHTAANPSGEIRGQIDPVP